LTNDKFNVLDIYGSTVNLVSLSKLWEVGSQKSEDILITVFAK